MFSLGCSCGRKESQTPLAQHQKDCFSYVVSTDGVHVCYPQNIVEYESIEEDEEDVFSMDTAHVCNPQTIIEYESAGEDETGTDLQNLVQYESTEVAAPEIGCPCSLLQRRGRSLSGMRLALSTSTQSTLVNPASHRAGESNVANHPLPQSGKHELVKQIGIDGEGVIHLMRRRSGGQLVVRKTVKYARSVYGKPIEATVLQDLFPEGHDNIIRLHAFESYQAFDSDRVDGVRYYLEYCSGGDLHQLVDRYRGQGLLLPELFIWQAYQQLTSALEFLHRGFDPRCDDPDRRGVCHRDIKPSNIFLRLIPGCAYPDLVLADFGHATLNFATYDPAGTTFWQAPELPRHSPRGDVYSLGAVMHFLIHFEAPIAKLPDGVPTTDRVKDAWESAPEARQPIMEFVDGYSEELICAMLIALEADENKRKNSSQLLRFVGGCFERRFPPGSDLLKEAEGWPLASWAFDHMMPASGRFEEDEDEEEEEDSGTAQYFEMMEVFGCGISRESSRSSSPAPSDWRRGFPGRGSEGSEMSSVSTLGKEY